MSTLTDQSNSYTGSTPIGAVVYYYPVLDSTNACAAKLLSKTRLKPGTIILAGHQTAGRGQIGRGWHDAPGLNLSLSCVLYPELPAQDQFHISMAVALAVRETIIVFNGGAHVSIKWPNDIYVGDQKIAGILIQNVLQGNAITSSIAGIGLNVNEEEFPETLPNPTSLKLQSNSPERLTISSVLETLVEKLSTRSAQIESSGKLLFEDYQKVLYRRDIPSPFRISGESHIRTGTILLVDAQGRLVIQWEDDSIGKYQHREIEFVL